MPLLFFFLLSIAAKLKSSQLFSNSFSCVGILSLFLSFLPFYSTFFFKYFCASFASINILKILCREKATMKRKRQKTAQIIGTESFFFAVFIVRAWKNFWPTILIGCHVSNTMKEPRKEKKRADI